MEQLDLTTPTTFFTVGMLVLDRIGELILINLIGPNNERIAHTYTGQEALTLMQSLNTANLTIKSLHRRILEKLTADGVITGTISGIPD